MSKILIVYFNKETGNVEGVGLGKEPFGVLKERANLFNQNADNRRSVFVSKIDNEIAQAFAYLLGENQYKHLKETDDLCDEVETLIDDIRQLDDTIDDLRGEFYDLNKRADRIKEAVAKLMPNA